MVKYASQKVSVKNNKEIIIRNLEPNDANQYFNFSEQIAAESSHTLHYPGQSIPVNFLKEKWLNAMESPWQLELGGFDENKLVSQLSIYKPMAYHPFERHSIDFAIRILKDYCSCGLGSLKMLIMENIAKEMDVIRIQARVRVSNQAALNFYLKLGYEIEGIKKRAVFISKKYEDEYYISKILDKK